MTAANQAAAQTVSERRYGYSRAAGDGTGTTVEPYAGLRRYDSFILLVLCAAHKTYWVRVVLAHRPSALQSFGRVMEFALPIAQADATHRG